MTVAMDPTTRSHREFITCLPGERWASREARVVSVRWLLAKGQARLLGNGPEVIAAADPPRLRKVTRTFIGCSNRRPSPAARRFEISRQVMPTVPRFKRAEGPSTTYTQRAKRGFYLVGHPSALRASDKPE
jgi:hypothetical protein